MQGVERGVATTWKSWALEWSEVRDWNDGADWGNSL